MEIRQIPPVQGFLDYSILYLYVLLSDFLLCKYSLPKDIFILSPLLSLAMRGCEHVIDDVHPRVVTLLVTTHPLLTMQLV